jgi:hypothetical protein
VRAKNVLRGVCNEGIDAKTNETKHSPSADDFCCVAWSFHQRILCNNGLQHLTTRFPVQLQLANQRRATVDFQI